jgi:hypothetical protein
MTAPERVHKYLTDRPRSAFCDDCIAIGASVMPRNQVNPIACSLALTRDFSRIRATCSGCGSEKLVTSSLL